jgi:2-keto-3-deoxy-6-phosphogluconate aldolase
LDNLGGGRFYLFCHFVLSLLAVCSRNAASTYRGTNIAVLPGGLTPAEVVTAWSAGADFVKVFPCGPVGGDAYIKALHGGYFCFLEDRLDTSSHERAY